MKRMILSLAAVAALALPVVASATEEVTVATGSTFIDKIFNPVKPQLAAVGLSVKIVFSDPAEAVNKLEVGTAEVAGASMTADEWMKTAEAKGSAVKDKASLVPHVVIEEETAVVVNAANSITSLSQEQLQGIFSGRIQNWKEVGGTDVPILIVWPRVASGATTTFSKQIMVGSAIRKEILDVASINDTVDAVASNPEAISIANAEKIKTGAKKVAAPALKRPLTLLTKGKPTPKVQKLLDFLQTAEARRAFR